jgi:hypothetical protein
MSPTIMSIRKAVVIDIHNEVSVKGNIEKNYLTTKVEEENKRNSLVVKFTLYECIVRLRTKTTEFGLLFLFITQTDTHTHTHTNIVTGLRSCNHIDVGRHSLLINVTVNA